MYTAQDIDNLIDDATLGRTTEAQLRKYLA